MPNQDRPFDDARPLDRSAVERAASGYAQVIAAAGGAQVEAVLRHAPRHDVAVGLYAAQPYELDVPAMPVSRLSINLTAARVTGGVTGERARSFDAARLAMFMMPAFVPAHWRKSTHSRHLNIYYDAPALGDEPDSIANWDAGGPMFNVALRGAAEWIEQLTAELSNPDPFTAEAVDCTARLLLLQFARRATRCGGLPLFCGALLRRLEHFVDAHLQQRILVADMAAAVGLPPGTFAQAYVRHSGRSPHQFVLTRRVQRALDLLRNGRTPIASVAEQSGFASQHHLTRVFSQRLGITPAALRQRALQDHQDP